MIRNSIKFGIVLVGGIFIMIHYIIPAQKGLEHYGCKASNISRRTEQVYQSGIVAPTFQGTDTGTSITPQNC